MRLKRTTTEPEGFCSEERSDEGNLNHIFASQK